MVEGKKIEQKWTQADAIIHLKEIRKIHLLGITIQAVESIGKVEAEKE